MDGLGLALLMDTVIRAQAVQPAQHALAVTFPEALDIFYVSRYTGSVVVHFAEGRPKRLEVPQAQTVKVVDR